MTQPRSVLARALLISATLAMAGGTAVSTVLLTAEPATAAVVDTDDVAASPASQAIDALQRGDSISYTILRYRVSVLVAPRAGLDPAQLDAVWAAADPRRMTAVLSALTQLGVPYHRRAATPGQAFDCSGLTSWAWAQSGVALPHQSGWQIHGIAPTSLDAVQPGDLLYYPGHVMLALGVGGANIQAPHRGTVVQIRGQTGRTVRVGNPLGAAG
jgi:cell wall-associated NlpC family hydrolase